MISERIALENEVYNELVGLEKYDRPRGYWMGVTANVISGVRWDGTSSSGRNEHCEAMVRDYQMTIKEQAKALDCSRAEHAEALERARAEQAEALERSRAEQAEAIEDVRAEQAEPLREHERRPNVLERIHEQRSSLFLAGLDLNHLPSSSSADIKTYVSKLFRHNRTVFALA